jgi:hypothetical protein
VLGGDDALAFAFAVTVTVGWSEDPDVHALRATVAAQAIEQIVAEKRRRMRPR